MNKLLFPLYQRKDGTVFHHKIYHRCSTMDIFITMLLSPSKLCSWRRVVPATYVTIHEKWDKYKLSVRNLPTSY